MKYKQNRINQLTELCNQLNLKFKDLHLLNIAFTHRSYLNEYPNEMETHNERMEFLGDAVLELIVSDYLYSSYKDRTEGELTSFRSAAVRAESLASEAKSLGLGAYLQMAKGEELTGGREKDYLLANCFEAIIGAIYIDQGYQEAQKFVLKHILKKLSEIVEKRLDIDGKSKFQEIAQSLLKKTPQYRVISQTGPDHEKTFKVGVYIDDQEYGIGTGSNKQKAEEEAANKAILLIQNDKKFISC